MKIYTFENITNATIRRGYDIIVIVNGECKTTIEGQAQLAEDNGGKLKKPTTRKTKGSSK